MDNTGYIKLHRNILESEIFNSADILQMWIWCLCKASYKDRKALIGNSAVDLKAGQFVCGGKVGSVMFNTSESTFHRRMDDAGANEVCIKLIMGHSMKNNVTKGVYTHKTTQQLIDEVNKI